MFLASSNPISSIAQPFFHLFALLLAAFYQLIPNYGIAIALLTITVMIVVFPITRRGTRSMMKMQLLAPEMKKLQARFKAQPGMSVTERQELRQQLNTEMMALYKENNVSPTGGCLPMFAQFPIFWILYGTIRGLIHTTGKGLTLKAQPLYISHTSRMYHDIVHAAPGHLNAFGINLADSVRSSGLTSAGRIPYIALILVAIALQYIQMRQLSGRNPAAAAANPQMQQMQKIFPIIFGVIYIAIPAGVNDYFIVSSLFRIAEQEFMYRRDPHIRESLERMKDRSKSDPKVIEAKQRIVGENQPKGLFARLLPPAPPATNGEAKASSNGQGGSSPKTNGKRPAPNTKANRPPQPRHSRSQGKRQRRPR